MSLLQLTHMAGPEVFLTIAAIAALFFDLYMMQGQSLQMRRVFAASIATLGCVAGFFFLLFVGGTGGDPAGMIVLDPTTKIAKLCVLSVAAFAMLLAADGDFTTHVGEYFALLLMSTVGMTLMVSSENLLMLFVALELASLSLYILVAFDKKSRQSAEAALKYFLFGGMSAAFMLFGLSLLYGLSGSLELHVVADKLAHRAMDPLTLVAMVMVLIGFGFKVAVAPFHLWAPDAYQGAPTASAAFVATGSKVAAFFLMAKVVMLAFSESHGSGDWRAFAAGWMPVVATLALFSMILGNLAALAQSSVKRLLAYSAIANAGYAMLGLLANNGQGMASILFFAVTYAAATLGAFGVVGAVERARGGDKLSDFAGLHRDSPWLSFFMLIFLLSLAGIPPLAGFFGKFYLFAAAVNAGGAEMGMLWLVIVAVAMSAVSLYYYLQPLKQIYVMDAPEDAGKLNVSLATWIGLIGLAVAVVVFGCAPDLLVESLVSAGSGHGH
jgi:NADH-quinone oxidoreductase subunit N